MASPDPPKRPRKYPLGARLIKLARKDVSISFGFAVASTQAGHNVIEEIKADGLAAGRLQRGDQILEVNGRDVAEMEHPEVVAAITASLTLDLVVWIRPRIVAVDWGTSSFRAWLLSARGRPLAFTRSDGGMSKMARETAELTAAAYEEHLQAKVGAWIEAYPHLPVMVCGMAGANKGWIEAPYATCPVSVASVAPQLVPVPNSMEWKIHLIPGLTCTAEPTEVAPSERDVMRGEETMILGLMTQTRLTDGVICMPGTHSKWVVVKDGLVQSFRTFMTGEIFRLMSRNSILRHSVDGEGFADQDEAAKAGFLDGVRRGHAAPQELTHALFAVRTRSLDGESAGVLRGYLSGLLIGAELAGTEIPETVHLVASGDTADKYTAAIEACGATVKRVPPEVACIGMLVLADTLPKPEPEEDPEAPADADESCVVM
eukprot:CAMPEP_0182926006 /NCGR_PEP_ID=MMETSP0105_2-20130417/10776_1 /TAXON_ID=81532 ORGANISM="Acanthoeca-like sp., Strain 10tr" /NCGR_SAMPLE_ID=MMETSP0105_2 /ASSEMBLY_ACC=CAM_ASM_000205 /LENGTH=430 /DNA_ID=CAMNT_0025063877 /DNA_START=15 /DNA_END=1307 /DNA_ORIENTATION=-